MIKLSNIVKTYKTVTAVNNISFNVNKGEIFALLGPNGAGKSSLVRMLVGFTLPDSGTINITIDDQQYASLLPQHLGYLPEDRGLYGEKTVQQNLLYFATLRGVSESDAKARIEHWLARFELTERAAEPLKSLSKGNQQKVQLISAILHQPKVVILDEPFSGLDPVNQEKVVLFLKQLQQQGMTVILSAHQMAMVEKLADRMLLMDHGQAVLYGSLSDIKQQTVHKTQISIRLHQAIGSQPLTDAILPSQFIQLSEKDLVIQLHSSDSVSKVVTRLAAVCEIESITSKESDLHQMYLQAIEGNKQEVCYA